MENREKIWRTLADTKANEFYAAAMAEMYLLADWIANTALGFVVIVSLVTAMRQPAESEMTLVLGIVIIFCITTMMLNPFLLFQKYIRVFFEKKTSLKHLSFALENLWGKVDDPRFTPAEIDKEFREILDLIIENDRFPDRTRVVTNNRIHREAVEKANEYLNMAFVMPISQKAADEAPHPHPKFWKTKLPGNPTPPAIPAPGVKGKMILTH